CRTVTRAAEAAFGNLHVPGNCAGLPDRGTILDTSPDLFDRMFAVTVRAPFFLMQAAIKIMQRERIAGSIVNLITMSSYGGQSFITAYCSSKGALVTLTRNVAFAGMPSRIRVHGLNVGGAHTPGQDPLLQA